MKRLVLFAFFLSVFIFPGCDNKTEPRPPAPPIPAPPAPPAPPPQDGYKVIHVQHGGDLAVEVYYKKNVRKRKIDTSKDAKCPELLDESIVVNEDKLLRDVVVYLDIREGKEPEKRARQVLNQDGWKYVPRLMPCRSGEAVKITSSDETSHNVHIHSPTSREINVSMKKGDELIYEVQGSANINVGCDIHPWMRALIVIEKHPYYALTNPDAELTNIPEGKYKLHAWHAELGELVSEVEVKAHSTTKVSLEYPQ